MILTRKTRIGAALAAAVLIGGAIGLPALAELRGGMNHAMQDGPGFGKPGFGGPGMMIDFARMDADKDGKVTLAEVTAFRANMVADADTDKDGLLSVDELAAHDVKMVQANAADRAAARVAAQDLNADGKLSVEEMLAPPMPANLFGHLDTDGDGAISQAEFDAAKALMQQGGRGDDDGDGHRHGRGAHADATGTIAPDAGATAGN